MAVDLDEINAEISSFPEQKLDNYLEKITKKHSEHLADLRKKAKWLFITVLAYLLIKSTVVEQISLGTFKIDDQDDLNIVLKFLPLISAYYLFEILSIANTIIPIGHAKNQFLERIYGKEENPQLISILNSTPNIVVKNTTTNNKKKVLRGCFAIIKAIPSLISILLIFIGVPVGLFIVIVTGIIHSFQSLDLNIYYKIINIISIILLILSLQLIYKAITNYFSFYYKKEYKQNQKNT